MNPTNSTFVVIVVVHPHPLPGKTHQTLPNQSKLQNPRSSIQNQNSKLQNQTSKITPPKNETVTRVNGQRSRCPSLRVSDDIVEAALGVSQTRWAWCQNKPNANQQFMCPDSYSAGHQVSESLANAWAAWAWASFRIANLVQIRRLPMNIQIAIYSKMSKTLEVKCKELFVHARILSKKVNSLVFEKIRTRSSDWFNWIAMDCDIPMPSNPWKTYQQGQTLRVFDTGSKKIEKHQPAQSGKNAFLGCSYRHSTRWP